MERYFPYHQQDSFYNLMMEHNGGGTATGAAAAAAVNNPFYAPPPQNPDLSPLPHFVAPPPSFNNPSAVGPHLHFNGAHPGAAERGSIPVFAHPAAIHGGGVVVSPPAETARKKRGRPRKYAAASEQGGNGVMSPSSSSGVSLPPSSSPKIMNGSAGQSFTPHVIDVQPGEDVAQKIMAFTQQCKRELCILSATGSISSASLRQPASSGGNITVEGRFEILSLSGSYIRTDSGGRTGGLSVCLSNTDGHIFGGGIGGPLKAADSVKVIIGTFLIDMKKDVDVGVKGDASFKVQFPVGPTVSNAGFPSAVEHSTRTPVGGASDHDQNAGEHSFMNQPQGMHAPHSEPTLWGGLDTGVGLNYDLTGTSHEGQESPENGNCDRIPD